MRFLSTIISIYIFSVCGDKIPNLRSDKATIKGIRELASAKNNNEEVRLMIQWKQAVVDNAAAMYSDSTQKVRTLESISFSQLLQMNDEIVEGKFLSLNASSKSSRNDEAVKVMLDSPRVGITAVAGSAEALEYYNLESHPAVEKVEIDVELEIYGFVDNPPNDVVNEFGSNGNKRTLSKATRNMQSTEATPYGITMVQANQIQHHPTNKMRVCVVDTGMDRNHPDLPKQQHGLLGWNHPSLYGNEKWYIDGHGHGTHVAGTIAAIKNNVGVRGVEDDPSRFYLSIGKGLSDNGRGYSSVVIDAISSCVNNHQAKVVNLSLGSTQHSSITEGFYKQMYNQGVLIVAAAGNSGNTRLNYPASYSTVMSVSATDSSRGHATFSTRNNQVEIAAPGVMVSSTYPNNRYVYLSGTSMASPHVAGVALKVWSWFPECSNTQIRNVLLRSVRTVRSNCDRYFGYGIVQASNALQMLRTHGCEAGGVTREPRHLYSPGGCQQLSYLQSGSPTPPPTINQSLSFIYLGCFQDRSDRALPNKMQGRFNTAYSCNVACYDAGFKYSGRQYIGECFCGNSGYDKYGSSDKCNDCNSFNVGGYLSCVYEVVTGGPTLKPTSLPSFEASEVPTNIPSDAPMIMPSSSPVFQPGEVVFKHLGCFWDRPDRALPNKMQGRFNTAHDCSMTCHDAGFKYSGRQHIGECWCGNSGYDKYGSSDKCNDCDSFDVGGWLSCVYEAFTSNTPTKTITNIFDKTNLRGLENGKKNFRAILSR